MYSRRDWSLFQARWHTPTIPALERYRQDDGIGVQDHLWLLNKFLNDKDEASTQTPDISIFQPGKPVFTLDSRAFL